MTAAERRRLTSQIRSAIETCGITRYEIAKRSGVDQSVLSRFVNGKGSLTLDSIEKLAPVLGLTLVVNEKR